MGLKSCEILLDNNWGAYYVGQTVTGRVEFDLDSPKKVRGVSILFKGDASTSWFIEETHTSNEGKQESDRIEVSGYEEYFKIEYYLIGGQGDEVEIPVGHHSYPFTCVLPPTLPSSFEGEYGYIRYIIQITFDRPWKFDQVTKKAFTVLSPLDLNSNPRLKEPAKLTLEKYFCCFCCKSGPLTCIVSIPRTGYVSGQLLPVVMEIDNISNIEITNVQLMLRKIVTYHTQTPRKEIRKDIKVITEIKIGSITPHGSNTYNQPITIPPIPPSNLTNCNLFDLDYELYVELNISGFHTNLTGKIPITIGTTPLAPTASAPTSINKGDCVTPPNRDISSEGPALGWIHNGNIYPALPTFAESQFGTSSIKEKGDNEYIMFSDNRQEYSPMYPVYSYSNN
ncbi:hypothetical protein FQR65_LT11078 [Abscondita terminalis]|nr:hypothetical protein FQR65_LT11078 [Abscondita terminalis]